MRRHAQAATLVLLLLTCLALAFSLWQRRFGASDTLASDPDAPRVAHFVNFVHVHSSPRGIGPLTDEEVRRRELSYRFHLRGDRVEKVEAVDRRGRPNPRHTVTTHLGPAESITRIRPL